MKHILIIPLLTLLAVSTTAQTKQEIKIRNKKNKAFSKELPSFVYIPSGSFTMGSAEKRHVTPNQVPAHTVYVGSHYMMQFEVSNFEYKEFVYSRMQCDSSLKDVLLPDTLVWRKAGLWNESYVDYYYSHPAYRNYPVVGISFSQAQAYADWMTEQYHKRPESERAYKKVLFRLPTEEEWEHDARGGLELSDFPWGGPYMRNSEGTRLANMLYVSQSSIYRDSVVIQPKSNQNDSIKPESGPTVRYLSSGSSPYYGTSGNYDRYGDITAPVRSYWPNGYGLYHMTGNVEEMVVAKNFRDDQKDSEVDPSGVIRGGSWHDTGYYGMVTTRQFYEGKESASAERGFRLVMDVVEY